MTALLILIYVAFISLGIPDSLLGAAWPAMHLDFGVSISLAGLLSAIVSTGTVVSGLCSARLIARFGTARVTTVSVLLTAVALLGIAINPSFVLMALLCVPLGLGGGAIDAALNNFVALHYQARHMNWLHCFWGIGATIGPALIGAILSRTGQWRSGYWVMAIVQSALTLVMFLSMPLWRKANEQEGVIKDEEIVPMKLRDVVRLPLALPVLISLLCYCGAESTMNLWGASYLVGARGIGADVAASWVSLFFLGVTGGRLLAGFLSQKLRSDQLVRYGAICSAVGALLLLLPLANALLPVGFFCVGLGFAPIYPSMLHQTPRIFGEKVSQSVMGIQMAFAYVGSTLLPPLLGALTHVLGMGFMPLFVLFLICVLLLCTSHVTSRVRAREK